MNLLAQIKVKIRLLQAAYEGVIFMLTATQKMWIDMYVKLIIAKRRTINDVQPTTLQPYVLEDLAILGYDGYGNPLPVEPVTESETATTAA